MLCSLLLKLSLLSRLCSPLPRMPYLPVGNYIWMQCRAMLLVQHSTLIRGDTARSVQLSDLALAGSAVTVTSQACDQPQGLSVLVEKEKNIVRTIFI